MLSEVDLLRTRRSDTAFVFGSGRFAARHRRREWTTDRGVRYRRVLALPPPALGESGLPPRRRGDLRRGDGCVDSCQSHVCGHDLRDGEGMDRPRAERNRRETTAPEGTRIFRWRRIARGRVAPASTTSRPRARARRREHPGCRQLRLRDGVPPHRRRRSRISPGRGTSGCRRGRRPRRPGEMATGGYRRGFDEAVARDCGRRRASSCSSTTAGTPLAEALPVFAW